MAQKHLYGINYAQLNPPEEWQDLKVSATIVDNFFSADIQNQTLTFTGDAATFIKLWVQNYGVFNGLPYRILIDDSEIVFDGFLVLSELVINSKLGPTIYKIPIRDLTDNLTTLDRVSVFTQGLLFDQGFLNNSNKYWLPVVQVGKTTFKDRYLQLLSLGYNVLNTILQIIQDVLSAISDMIGLSLPVGVVEFSTLMLNIFIQITQLQDLILAHKDLILASQTYYPVLKLKDVIEAAFEKLGKTVEWGIIENDINRKFVKSSENGFPGVIAPGIQSAGDGTLKPQDWGYLISEAMQEIEKIYNTRIHDEGDIVHIKTQSDPFWVDNPSFAAESVLVSTTKQYQNGIYRNKTEEVFATTRVTYEYDPADAHTLVTENGDAYEIHRDLINELDPRMNTMKGLQDIKINWALASRYDPIEDILFPLFDEILGDSNNLLNSLKNQITQFAQYIDPGSNSEQSTADFLAINPLDFILALSPGGLKVEDDTWGIPKFIDADANELNKTLTIPADFKSRCSAEFIYKERYLPESPAIQNNFAGQNISIEQLRIPFSLSNYQNTKQNPYFNFDGLAKFNDIEWNENQRSAEVTVEKKEIFDDNITETEI